MHFAKIYYFFLKSKHGNHMKKMPYLEGNNVYQIIDYYLFKQLVFCPGFVFFGFVLFYPESEFDFLSSQDISKNLFNSKSAKESFFQSKKKLFRIKLCK